MAKKGWPPLPLSTIDRAKAALEDLNDEEIVEVITEIIGDDRDLATAICDELEGNND